jgi:hypothetical protein
MIKSNNNKKNLEQNTNTKNIKISIKIKPLARIITAYIKLLNKININNTFYSLVNRIFNMFLKAIIKLHVNH